LNLDPRGLPVRAALAVLPVLSAPAASALDPDRPLTQFVLQTWGMNEGLPQNTIAAIVQTRDGYLWLGTQEGLARFDGVRFTVFDRANTPELGHNTVWRLYEDRAGRLWIGTVGGGLTVREGSRFTRYGEAQGLPSDQISSILEDRRGRIWVGTNGAGLVRLDSGRFVREEALSGLPSRFVTALAEDARGRLWIGSEAGLSVLDGNELRTFTRKDGLVEDVVTALVAGRDGSLWVGTDSRGVSRLAREGGFASYTTKHGLSGDRVRALLEDDRGSLWIGTEGGGLSRLHAGRIDRLTAEDGLPAVSVRALLQDREGSLWLGLTAGGLLRLRGGSFRSLTTREGLFHDHVYSILEARDGALWIGVEGALDRLQDGRITHTRPTAGGRRSGVFSLLETRDGSLWIGTNGDGLSRLRDGRMETFTSKDGLANDVVESLLEDPDGSLWIGTRRGLSRFRQGRFTTHGAAQGLTDTGVPVLLRDSAGTLWIGTHGEGLIRVQNGAVTKLTARDGLSSGVVVALHEDRDRALWVGTYGGGVNRFKDGRFAAITTSAGLADDGLAQILEDDHGFLWFTSNRRIFRVAKRELDDVADGRRERVTSEVFGTADGMKSSDCAGGFQPAGTRTRDGRLFFPTRVGAVVVDPGRIRGNALPPPVSIEQARLDQRSVDVAGVLRVPPGTNAVEIHYAALSYVDPSKMRFKYRLAGFDPDWLDAGTRRVAYYTRIPPGSYEFRVAASNNSGVWNEAGASLALEVVPRLHEAGWFRLLALLAGGLGLAIAYRARVHRIRARERELVAVVEDRTRGLRDALAAAEGARQQAEERGREADAQRARAEEANRAKSVFLATMSHELRTPLNVVLGFAQLMDRAGPRTPEDRQHLARIRKNGEHLLELIDDVLSLARIETGQPIALLEAPFELRPLLFEVEAMLRLRAEARGLDFVVQADAGLPPRVTGDARRLRQILINLLANAVKFTERGSVTLRARWHSGRGVFEVEDTGPGIAPAELEALFQTFAQAEAGRRSLEGAGLGLALSRQLARAMRGDIQVESAPGRGTRFRVEIELEAAAEIAPAAPPQQRVRCLLPGQPEWRVLVVDDVADNRVLLSKLLASVGFSVREAGSGEEAIEVWRAWQAQLIWLDTRMPGMGGLAAARHIRDEERRSGRARTAILALSASAMAHERAEVLAAGCDDFVSKPIRESDLFEKTAAWLGAVYARGDGHGTAASAASPRRFAPDQSVLVVDDQAANREVARALLAQSGLACREAAGGEEALGLLASERADAVLLDIEMPGMDGIQTLRAIRSSEMLRRLPVVALTAHVTPEERARVQQAGADAHLAKPVDFDQLVEVLARFLRAADAPAHAVDRPSEFAGFDVAFGLRQLAGDAALHRRLVGDLVAQLHGFTERVGREIDGGDEAAAVRSVHAVRGAAATLGAQRLASAAADLETALRREPGSRPSLAGLSEAVAEILAGYGRAESEVERADDSVDALTGVGNRRRFERVLHEEWPRASRAGAWLSLAMVEVDHFKRFNDRHGHARGDFCLRAVAQALQAACRRPADRVVRYGGEKFALVLPDTDPVGARHAVQNALRQVRALSIPHDDSPCARHVTVSIGAVSVVPAAGRSAEAALESADRLLFAAKTLGRNRALQSDLASNQVTTLDGGA
jgi:diguanylate cyclase (GGDEF)-like protein